MHNLDLENTFQHNVRKTENLDKYTSINNKAKELANLINNICPPCRERKWALIDLEQVVMWSNVSIERNG